MKKILLSSAIAAALGTAGIANAAVDLDASPVLPLTFVQEIANNTLLDVTAAGTNGAGNNAGAAGFVKTFGFSIGEGTSKYVRLEFSHPLAARLDTTDFAHLAGTLPPVGTLGPVTYAPGTATFAISSGGQAGDTVAIIEVTQPTGAGADIQSYDRFAFAPAADKISAHNKAAQSVSYTLYETATQATNPTATAALVPTTTKTWIEFGKGYNLACTGAAGVRQIDVTSPFQFVGNVLGSNVATVNIAGSNAYRADGVRVLLTDYFGAGSKVGIKGSTDGFEIAAGITLNAVSADNPPANGAAEWTAVADPAAEFNGTFAVTADGTNDMDASSYTLSITPAGNETYGKNLGTQEVACGALQFSGSTDRLDFALTPNGVFKQMVRITNPSATAGAVTVTVINDNGKEVRFDLDDIAGVDSSVLDAKASTKLIDINDIYAAAKAQDSSFALAGQDTNKLRVVVRGNFGGDAVEGFSDTSNFSAGERLVDRREDGIYIQGLTVSRDNNAFFQTK